MVNVRRAHSGGMCSNFISWIYMTACALHVTVLRRIRKSFALNIIVSIYMSILHHTTTFLVLCENASIWCRLVEGALCWFGSAKHLLGLQRSTNPRLVSINPTREAADSEELQAAQILKHVCNCWWNIEKSASSHEMRRIRNRVCRTIVQTFWNII